jgi:hypothetical protein
MGKSKERHKMNIREWIELKKANNNPSESDQKDGAYCILESLEFALSSGEIRTGVEGVCEWKKVDRDEFDKLVCIVGCTKKGRSNSDFTYCPDCSRKIKISS